MTTTPTTTAPKQNFCIYHAIQEIAALAGADAYTLTGNRYYSDEALQQAKDHTVRRVLGVLRATPWCNYANTYVEVRMQVKGFGNARRYVPAFFCPRCHDAAKKYFEKLAELDRLSPPVARLDWEV